MRNKMNITHDDLVTMVNALYDITDGSLDQLENNTGYCKDYCDKIRTVLDRYRTDFLIESNNNYYHNRQSGIDFLIVDEYN